MRKLIKVFLAVLIVVTASCKKESSNPNENTQDAYTTLQGKWRATQQSATVNGQSNGQTEYFNGDEAIFEFTGSDLATYNGSDQSSTYRKYTWRVSNGELIIREQNSNSAKAYNLSFEGENSFVLKENYTSVNGQISITIHFVKK